MTGATIRQQIGQDDEALLMRPPMQRLSSTEEASNRQPQAPSAAASSTNNKPSKAGQIKNAMVSKFSKYISKYLKFINLID